MMMRVATFLCLASPAFAFELSLPNVVPTKVETQAAASVRLPTSPWSPGSEAPVADGAVRRTVFQNSSNALTTLQLLTPFRQQLAAKGYREVFTCSDAICGGFDFRFQLDLIGEPDMHVDLGNYRYALLTQPGASPHTVALVTSPSLTAGFIHMTEVSDAAFPAVTVEPAESEVSVAPTPAPTSDQTEQLVATGRTVLGDLEFGTGSAELGQGPFSSLTRLSEWLDQNASARVVLVGHTDAVGSLEANTSLSRRRALAVADRLVVDLNVNPIQLQAAGAGYLSPLATNLTPDGRAANRRVEVVLLSLE